MDKELLIAIAKKNINAPGLINDIIDEVVEKAIDKFIADTSNPYDDMLKAALWPVIEKEVKEKLAELWAGL
jgi:hypothetical protein